MLQEGGQVYVVMVSVVGCGWVCRQVIVGMNKYRLAKESAVDVLSIDNTSVRKQQVGT